MAERPIIFSGPMVRAILDGRKTQTRRLLRPQPEFRAGCWYWRSRHYDNGAGAQYLHTNEEAAKRLMPRACPYGFPGDRLWVRETWQQVHPCQIDEGRFSLPGTAGIPGPPAVSYRVIYRADGEYPRCHFSDGYPYRERCQPDCTRDHTHPQEAWHGWTPSIFMPRWASRITLEVTAIRVQRVREINETDAEAEGAERLHEDHLGQTFRSYRRGFEALWDSINAKRAPWESNPWVWVVEFQRAA